MARKQAAVFLSNLYGDMVRDTTEGVVSEARKNGVKLLFFTSFADDYTSKHYDRYLDYDMGDFVVYMLADLRKYDALIYYDTYMPASYVGQMDHLIDSATCPVISLGAVKKSACSIVSDQKRALRELIEHVITVHGCRDFMHVAGIAIAPFVQERISIFKEVMADYGLDGGDDRILYGDLSPDCGDAMVEAILAKYAAAGGKPLPDAIVCANDFMAIGVIDALEKRGYAVPGDVIVTGYDDVLRAQLNTPSITTCAQPFVQVGVEGIQALMRIWRGESVPAVIAASSALRCRQSCGCQPMNATPNDSVYQRFINTVNNLENLSLASTDLVLGTAVDENLQDIFDEIETSCRRETGFTDAVLCLIDGWDKQRVITNQEALLRERFEVVCGIYNDRPVKRGWLPDGSLLPDEMQDDPEPYFLFPIHYLQYFMGYFIVSPRLREQGQLHIKTWLVSIATVLENWRIHRQLTQTVETLNRLYQTDALTGLYNRHSYHRDFESYYNQCREAGAGLAVFLIDMNRMKYINDNYGHEEGDYCLRAIANALIRASCGDEICVRAGGDEFVVLARNYDGERARAYIRAVREDLERACARDGKAYRIGVSIGYDLRVPHEVDPEAVRDESEAFLRRADEAMYQEKRKQGQ